MPDADRRHAALPSRDRRRLTLERTAACATPPAANDRDATTASRSSRAGSRRLDERGRAPIARRTRARRGISARRTATSEHSRAYIKRSLGARAVRFRLHQTARASEPRAAALPARSCATGHTGAGGERALHAPPLQTGGAPQTGDRSERLCLGSCTMNITRRSTSGRTAPRWRIESARPEAQPGKPRADVAVAESLKEIAGSMP